MNEESRSAAGRVPYTHFPERSVRPNCLVVENLFDPNIYNDWLDG
jgi:hypothetical protein